MTTKVADKVAEWLEDAVITHAFGIIGAGNVHLFEAIAQRGFTKIICVHHEQAATMAMQGYYRIHKKIAAVLLTTGGGATNSITGVVSAWADSIPGLIIAGNENAKFLDQHANLRMWGVQGYDTVQMVEKVTKYGSRVIDGAQAVYELQKAHDIALSGRPGPVWVEIPMSVQSSQVESFTPPPPPPPVPKAAKVSEVQSAAIALRDAKRPVILLGHGIRLAGAEDKLHALLDAANVPAMVSWAGIDMVESEHPMLFGRPGVYGQRAANFIMQNCDYMLAIGTRLALPQVGYDVSELMRGARLDVVDIDEHEATKLGDRVTQPIVADAGDFITVLLDELKRSKPSCPEWVERCNQYRTDYPWIGPEHADVDGYMNMYPFMPLLAEYMKDDAIVVTDMGTALLCGHQVLPIRAGQRLLTSTGLGEMGFGLPAAIGSCFANDKKEVICLNCDGGMMMNLQELQTVVHHELPLKIFVFNNDGYLMIKHTQKSLFGGMNTGVDKKTGVSCPDYTKVAKAFDIPSFTIRTWDEAREVLPKVMAATGPVICEVFMHPEQLFAPKLSMAMRADGLLVSPPIEDLSPLLPLVEMERAMEYTPLHDKTRSLRS